MCRPCRSSARRRRRRPSWRTWARPERRPGSLHRRVSAGSRTPGGRERETGDTELGARWVHAAPSTCLHPRVQRGFLPGGPGCPPPPPAPPRACSSPCPGRAPATPRPRPFPSAGLPAPPPRLNEGPLPAPGHLRGDGAEALGGRSLSPGRRHDRPESLFSPGIGEGGFAGDSCPARRLQRPGPSGPAPHPPVALTPTLPNPLAFAARAPALGPPTPQPQRREDRFPSLVLAAPGAGSGLRGLRNPGVGDETLSPPAVGDPFPLKCLPPTRLFRISLYFRDWIGKKKKSKFVCLLLSVSFFPVGKGRRFLRDTIGFPSPGSSRPHDPASPSSPSPRRVDAPPQPPELQPLCCRGNLGSSDAHPMRGHHPRKGGLGDRLVGRSCPPPQPAGQI